MESTLQKTAGVATTTAHAQLRLPEVAEAFSDLGFPAYLRVELSWVKFVGVAPMLAPAPARLKEWAYAGFAIDLASALIARLRAGDGPEARGFCGRNRRALGPPYRLRCAQVK